MGSKMGSCGNLHSDAPEAGSVSAISVSLSEPCVPDAPAVLQRDVPDHGKPKARVNPRQHPIEKTGQVGHLIRPHGKAEALEARSP